MGENERTMVQVGKHSRRRPPVGDYRNSVAAVPVQFEESGDREAGARLLDQIDLFGFGIASFSTATSPAAATAGIAGCLNLGDLAVPALYANSGNAQLSDPLTNITVREAGTREPGPASDHPAFNRRSGQPLHVDGLLDDPRDIPTAMLFCVRPAMRGGATFVFNSTGALMEMLESHPALGEALLEPNILRRTSNLPGVPSTSNTSFGFLLEPDGSMTGRFCLGPTDTWITTPKSSVLQDALVLMGEMAREGSRFYRAINLLSNQCLVWRNDLISHGREEYEDGPDLPRHLVRCLYTEAPR